MIVDNNRQQRQMLLKELGIRFINCVMGQLMVTASDYRKPRAQKEVHIVRKHYGVHLMKGLEEIDYFPQHSPDYRPESLRGILPED